MNLSMKDSVWVEKYRPKTINDYVCDSNFKRTIEQWIKNGLDQHLLLAGPAGTGKTSLALLLIRLLKAESLILNASDERGLDVLRDKVKRFASILSSKPKIILLDEFDYVTKDFQVASRGVIEKFTQATRFILTCNEVNRIIDAIQSRCKVIKVEEMPKKQMAIRTAMILKNENIDFDTDDLKKLVNTFYPDMRKLINSLQLYSKSGKLKVDFNDIIEQDFKSKIYNLIENKDLRGIRQVISNEPIEYTTMYHYLYKKLEDHGARPLLIIADYLYKDALVANKEINFAACCAELIEIIKGVNK